MLPFVTSNKVGKAYQASGARWRRRPSRVRYALTGYSIARFRPAVIVLADTVCLGRQYGFFVVPDAHLIFRMADQQLQTLTVSRPEFNRSGYTHNLAPYDLDSDGLLEVISAYCGHGEIIRYDYENGLGVVRARKLHQLSGSGEESLIADVDNDGRVEYITSNGFRKEDASVEIFEFDDSGELILPPRIVIEGYDETWTAEDNVLKNNNVVNFTPLDAIDFWCRVDGSVKCLTAPGSHYHLTAFTANNTVKDKNWQEGMVLLDDTSDFNPYHPATYNGDNIIKLGRRR